MSGGSCSSCNCNPCQCNCSCDPQNEAFSSAFANFTLEFIGTIDKTCVNGAVVWGLPCGLDSSEPVSGIPKLTGESVFCYFLRVMQILAADIAGIVLPLAISSGGTGATTAAGARTNLDAQVACANLDLWCLKDPPSGNVVGTTDSQTLTNKTFTNAANTQQTLTDAATIAWDMNLGAVATVALTANRAMGLPTNLKIGTYYLVTTGAFAITSWNAIFQWQGGSAPSGSGTKNAYSFFYDGSKLIGSALTNVS